MHGFSSLVFVWVTDWNLAWPSEFPPLSMRIKTKQRGYYRRLCQLKQVVSEECLSQQRTPHLPSFPLAIWTFLLCVWNASILDLSCVWVWAGSARVCFSINGLFSSMWLQVPEGPQSGRAVWLAGGGLVLIADNWCWGGWLRKRESEREEKGEREVEEVGD